MSCKKNMQFVEFILYFIDFICNIDTLDKIISGAV